MGIKRGKIAWIVFGGIIILAILSVFIFQNNNSKDIDLPSCEDKKEIFPYYPVNLSIVERLTPQG